MTSNYLLMQLSPNKWPHFNITKRCGPLHSHKSKQIEHVVPSSSSSFNGSGAFFGDGETFGDLIKIQLSQNYHFHEKSYTKSQNDYLFRFLLVGDTTESLFASPVKS